MLRLELQVVPGHGIMGANGNPDAASESRRPEGQAGELPGAVFENRQGNMRAMKKQNENREGSLSEQILAEAEQTLQDWERENQARESGGRGVSRESRRGRPDAGNGRAAGAGRFSGGRGPGGSRSSGGGRPSQNGRTEGAREDTGIPRDGRTPCPAARKCGGCQLQNMTYPEQLKWKQGKAERFLRKFCSVSPIIGMENPWHYRNKVQAAFGVTRDGRTVSGVYQSSRHGIVPVDACMIEDRKADAIIVSIRKLMKDFRITAYSEYRQEGLLRHVLVKRGFSTNEIMVVLVTSGPVFPAKHRFVQALLKLHPEITTIVQNINRDRDGLALGERENILYGSGYIEDRLCGFRFRISPRSFYQINPVQTEKLYAKAMELAALTGTETVIDAYCGIGTIGMAASRNAGRVIGVESNPDAVRDAAANARANGVTNISFTAADAGDFMRDMADSGERADVVFTDPPRAGCSEAFLSALARLAPGKIVYVSCNPETQARDLDYLVRKGYRVRAAQPVDMFPHTNHVETVCLLSRNS